MLLLKLPADGGDEVHGVRLPAADVDVTGQISFHGPELFFRFVRHGHDLLRPLPQEHPFGGQGHPVIAPDQQLLPQFLLQIPQLTG